LLFRVVFDVNHTNVCPDTLAMADTTPSGVAPPLKLLNDGVTFADGLVRVTVTLHDPTVKSYAFVLRPPENAHWIALVP